MIKLMKTGIDLWSLEGELTFDTVCTMVLAGPEVGDKRFAIVNLSGLTRGDSAGLALLVEWLASSRAKGGDIRYVGLPPKLGQLVRVLGLDFLDSDNKC
jgi:phospholipid transport system transporter-binding protein